MTHQTGKITYRANGEANSYAILNEQGRWLFSLLHNGQELTPMQECNLRRMVACWNACDGTPTSWLEAQSDPEIEAIFGAGTPLHHRMQRALYSVTKIEEERDAALVRAQELERHLRELLALHDDPMPYDAATTRAAAREALGKS